MDHTILRCARIILRNRTASLGAETYDSTGLLPFCAMATLRCLMRVYQLLASDATGDYLPPFFSNEIMTRGVTGRKFLLPSHKRNMDVMCFNYMAAKKWNELIQSATESTNFTYFYNAAKSFVLKQYVL